MNHQVDPALREQALHVANTILTDAGLPSATCLRDTLAALREEAVHCLHGTGNPQKLRAAIEAAAVVFDPAFLRIPA